jgi:hypothetical protein
VKTHPCFGLEVEGIHLNQENVYICILEHTIFVFNKQLKYFAP